MDTKWINNFGNKIAVEYLHDYKNLLKMMFINLDIFLFQQEQPQTEF